MKKDSGRGRKGVRKRSRETAEGEEEVRRN
jgi:hypothetical protein